jgi:hypothetical protein
MLQTARSRVRDPQRTPIVVSLVHCGTKYWAAVAYTVQKLLWKPEGPGFETP